MLYKNQLFKKNANQMIYTNAFGIYVQPLWETNIDAQYILDPYAITLYFMFNLTKIDKFVTQEMKIILEKM
jgi:hypothetical protein